jgi:hypothetical protein
MDFAGHLIYSREELREQSARAAQAGTLVPVPPQGTVLLVTQMAEDRLGFVLADTERLCRSPDKAWEALRGAWIRLAEQERERS